MEIKQLLTHGDQLPRYFYESQKTTLGTSELILPPRLGVGFAWSRRRSTAKQRRYVLRRPSYFGPSVAGGGSSIRCMSDMSQDAGGLFEETR